jgi:glycosyltransferase involved in cell wall biosynthesis
MVNKKIIIAGPLPPPYFGVSNATKITIEGLKNDFDILHLDTSDRREELNFGKYDIHNVYLGIRSLIHCILLLLKNPDILYIPISQSFPAYYRDAGFIILGWFFRKKIVLHLRGGYFREFYNKENGFRRFIIKYTVSKSDKVIVLGKSLKYLFKDLVDENKIVVVSNGVDTELYKPDISKKDNGKFRICFISNFELHKGWREILECAVLLKNEQSNYPYEIIMAGKWRDDNDKKFGMDYVNRNNISEIVSFKESITGDDKIRLLQSSHLFLMPTSYRYEGQPWAIIEAMACGLPVVTSPKGCIEETVSNGKNGYIIHHDDIEAMKSIILKFLNDSYLCRAMGDESRRIAENHFSRKIFLENMRKVLSDV